MSCMARSVARLAGERVPSPASREHARGLRRAPHLRSERATRDSLCVRHRLAVPRLGSLRLTCSHSAFPRAPAADRCCDPSKCLAGSGVRRSPDSGLTYYSNALQTVNRGTCTGSLPSVMHIARDASKLDLDGAIPVKCARDEE